MWTSCSIAPCASSAGRTLHEDVIEVAQTESVKCVRNKRGNWMDQNVVGHDIDRTTGSSARYARWHTLDTTQQDGHRVSCWLDRKTGRLLYQPPGLDPNLLTIAVGPLFSYVG